MLFFFFQHVCFSEKTKKRGGALNAGFISYAKLLLFRLQYYDKFFTKTKNKGKILFFNKNHLAVLPKKGITKNGIK